MKRQANVMLSYPINEAEELLTTKLAAAKQSLANCEEDLDFLREQITVSRWVLRYVSNGWFLLIFRFQTMEVATARVYNWDVTMKRKEKTEQEAIEEQGKAGSPNG